MKMKGFGQMVYLNNASNFLITQETAKPVSVIPLRCSLECQKVAKKLPKIQKNAT